MTLPSNRSMNYYEDNTAAQCTTKLAQTIELDGDWEVGLSSIGVPAEVENVIAKECYCNYIEKLHTVYLLLYKPML